MRANIDNMIGDFDHIGVMFDHDDGVAFVAQFLQQFVHAVDIARVQADTRFVKDIHHIDQAAAEMFDDFDALRFAAGQGVGWAVEAEVFEANIDQMLQAVRLRIATIGAATGSLIALITSISSPTSIADSSAMLQPLILQLSAAWLRRAPLTERAGLHGDVGFDRFLRALRHGFDDRA